MLGCSPTKKLTQGYFNSDKKLGVLLRYSEFELTKVDAAHGLSPLEWAASFGLQKALNKTKDEEVLAVRKLVAEEHPQLKEEIVQIFKDIHNKHQVNYKILDLEFDSLNLPLHEPAFMRRKQAKYSYQGLGREHDIDQLMIINMQNYIELDGLNKRIKFSLTPLVVDMADNSFVYAMGFSNQITIIGKWRDPPEYQKLLQMIEDNISIVFKRIDKSLN